jgi:hypothetical protein
MASTPEGEALTESHRVAQVKLKAVSVADVTRLLQDFDITDPFASWARIEREILLLIDVRRRASGLLTGSYFSAFHEAEDAAGSPVVRLAQRVGLEDVAPNLRLVGPVWASRSGDMASFTSNVSSEVVRRVLEGERETLLQSVEATDSCIGYYRVTDGSPCAFCALMVARGAVYSARTVRFEAHRGCACTGEPLYRRDQPPVNAEQADRFSAIYDSIPSSFSGPDRVREFQRRYRAAQT